MPWGLLFKSLKIDWFEWVLVGVLLMAGTITYLTYSKLRAAHTEIAQLETQVQTAQRNQRIVVSIRDLEDGLVRDYLEEIIHLRDEFQQSTFSFHDAYRAEIEHHERSRINDVSPPPSSEPLPPVAPVVRQPCETTAPAPTPHPSLATDRNRASLIAERLRHAYCNAVGDSGLCSTQ
jgi:hypothetical protein